MRFSWDAAKERANLARHGVDFTTAQQVFADPQALVLFDEAHSNRRELRWWLLGRVGGRILLASAGRGHPAHRGRLLEGGTRLL